MSKAEVMGKVKFAKITLFIALDANYDLPGGECHVDDMAERIAESVRELEAPLTVCSEYDEADVEIAADADTDTLIDTMTAQFTEPVLKMGPVPGVKVLGRNGTFKHARLERMTHHIDLWLGTPKERFPLVSFPVVKP